MEEEEDDSMKSKSDESESSYESEPNDKGEIINEGD